MNQQRPLSVTLLALIAALAAALALVHALQLLAIIPPLLGAVGFFANDALGTAAWVALALASVWLVSLLLSLDARGWLLMAVVCALLLTLGMACIVGGSDAAAMLPAILLGGVGLLLMALPGVREAFRGLRWG